MEATINVTSYENNALVSIIGKTTDPDQNASTVTITSLLTVLNENPMIGNVSEIPVQASSYAVFSGNDAQKAVFVEAAGDDVISSEVLPIARNTTEPEAVLCLPTGQPQHVIESVSGMGKPRVTCHRCGNVRKNTLSCKACLQVYCVTCAQKFESTSNTGFRFNTTGSSCPVCEGLCCCANSRGSTCDRQFHCYRRCEISRVKSNKVRGRKRVREGVAVNGMSESNQMNQFSMPWGMSGRYPMVGMSSMAMNPQDAKNGGGANGAMMSNNYFAQEMQRRFAELTASIGYYSMPGMANGYASTYQGLPMTQGIPLPSTGANPQMYPDQSAMHAYPMNRMNMGMLMHSNAQQMQQMQQQQQQQQFQQYQSSHSTNAKSTAQWHDSAWQVDGSSSTDALTVGMNMAATALALLANVADISLQDDAKTAADVAAKV